MISPTGSNRIRSDSHGFGHWGAPRGNRKHDGVDYTCTPGQSIVSPITGVMRRYVDPYGDKSYNGLEIKGVKTIIQLLYVYPEVDVKMVVQAGQCVGIAQDISKRYDNDMIPHIHMRIISIDPDMFVSMF